MDLENGQDAFDLMSNITDSEPSEPTTEVQESTQENPASQSSVASEPNEVDGLKQTVSDLQRVIASDPNLRAQYARMRYGEADLPYQLQQEQVPQHSHPQANQQLDQQTGLPFDPKEYDWTSYEHQAALMNHLLQQQLQPFTQYIQGVQQQEQQHLQREAFQQVQKIDSGISDQFEKMLPGYAEWFDQNTPETAMLGNFISNAFEKTLMELHPPLGRDQYGNPTNPYWYHEKVHSEVVSKIVPQVQSLAAKLGFQLKTPNTATAKTKAKEMYTEGSNAIPASSGGSSFDKAMESGNLADAMAALVSK